MSTEEAIVVSAKKTRKKSGPARAYVYGAMEPVEGLESIRNQFRLAHDYKNKLIEIERNRRQKCEELIREACPELATIDSRIDEINDRISSIRDEVKARRVVSRKRCGSAESRAEISALSSERKLLNEKRKGIRHMLYGDMSTSGLLQQVEDDSHAESVAARSEYSGRGLFWGTYLIIEDSCKNNRKGAPPSFVGRKPGGTIAVQIQGGMSFDRVLSCNDTRVRIEPVDDDAWSHASRGERRRKHRTRLWIRIGSDGVKPVWAVVPFILHRPIPPDAMIKWVKLFERKVGTHSKWQVLFQLEFKTKPLPDDLAAGGVVGVDTGWRKLADGSIRAAYWAGSDGRHGEVVYSRKLLARGRKVRDLEKIQDKAFDDIKTRLLGWLALDNGSQWLNERLANLGRWRACGRLAAVALDWRNNRFDGDGEMFDAVEAWRKQDKHLYDWLSFQRKSVLLCRRDMFRNFAAELRRRYATIAVEKINYSKFQRKPNVEDGDVDRGRSQRTIVAPAELVSSIKSCGAAVVEVPPQYSSQTCSGCGHRNAGLGAADSWVCPACLRTWDRDHNAAINHMLAAMKMSARGDVA